MVYLDKEINNLRGEILKNLWERDKMTATISEIKDLVSYLNEGYKTDGLVDVKKAIEDMGIHIIEGAEDDTIVVTGNHETTFSTSEETGTKKANKTLTRLLGVYLFTDEMSKDSIFMDKELDRQEEDILNNLSVLISLPDYDFSVLPSTPQVVKWSIELGIPLPILKSTLGV